jgi:ElaB/YqjD/DUF883 family membrane-anchored ribosome-binding protein
LKTESEAPAVAANRQGASRRRSTAPAADSAMSGVSLEFHNFVADIEDLIKSTTSLSGDDLASAKEKIGERIAAAKESAEAMGDALAHRAGKAVAVTNEYVHEQPWKAIGIAAAVGFLLGAAVARRA